MGQRRSFIGLFNHVGNGISYRDSLQRREGLNLALSLLISLLPLVYWYRFRMTALDHDYALYCYPAVFGTRYLEDGHVEVKPPLAHWSYKIWVFLTSRLKLPMLFKLRLIPFVALSSAVFLLTIQFGLTVGFPLALLLISPSLWPHMAQTEWLTVLLMSLAITAMGLVEPLSLAYPTTPILAELARGAGFVLLGMLPWVNQKNILVAFLLLVTTIGLGRNSIRTLLTIQTIIQGTLLILPGILFLTYIAMTGRLKKFYESCVLRPKHFAKNRSHATHTNMTFSRGWIWEAAPFVAIMDWHSPWTIVFVGLVIGLYLSKQVIPFHLMPLAIPIALAARPEGLPMALVGFLAVWLTRSLVIWRNPTQLYKATFGGGGGDYQMILDDADTIEKWIAENTREDEVIWVNGIFIHFYLKCHRRAWQLNIAEMEHTVPDGEPPRVIVHGYKGHFDFDYEAKGYERILISRMGQFILYARP